MSTKKIFPEGLIGRKIGMTQYFNEEGLAVPVTALELGPCTILDVKNQDANGYSAVQFGFAPKKAQRANKAEMGHFNRSAKGAFSFIREMRCDAETLGWTKLGHEVCVTDVFEVGEKVDVSGNTIGRGFAGVFKRYGMKGQPATRGTHESKRGAGSIGQGTSPGRVFKNKKMPGHLGNERVTVQNLRVVAVHEDQGVVLVKGCVPGAKGCFVEVKKAMQSYTGAVKRVADEGGEAKQAENQEGKAEDKAAA